MANDIVASTKVITGTVRFSYLHVWEPTAMEGEQEKKYSVSLIISKDDKATVAKVKAAIKAAEEQGKTSKFGGKIPTTKFRVAFQDGDIERPEDEAYENSYFINAKCKNKPGLVDKNLNPIMDQDDLYSGCFGRASITFYPYNANGSKGIAAGLNNLQKLKEGDPLGSRSTAENDFGDLPADTDDDLLD